MRRVCQSTGVCVIILVRRNAPSWWTAFDFDSWLRRNAPSRWTAFDFDSWLKRDAPSWLLHLWTSDPLSYLIGLLRTHHLLAFHRSNRLSILYARFYFVLENYPELWVAQTAVVCDSRFSASFSHIFLEKRESVFRLENGFRGDRCSAVCQSSILHSCQPVRWFILQIVLLQLPKFWTIFIHLRLKITCRWSWSSCFWCSMFSTWVASRPTRPLDNV